LVSYVYPNIKIDKNQIVYKYSGVRPLGASGDINPGVISRDYRIVRTSSESEVPVLSLVGGKWTTFRALGEHLSSDVLKLLKKSRAVSTANLPLGGGKDFPTSLEAQLRWAENHGKAVGTDRALQLLLRYGTRALEFIDAIAQKGEKNLQSNSEYSDTEIQVLIAKEQVARVEDIVHRRTNLAFSGEVSDALLQELETILTQSHAKAKAAAAETTLNLDEGSRI
jgi:glycerol-3-phosphate dehydrogenase